MKCLDDCHTYQLDDFLGEYKFDGSQIPSKDILPLLHFYEMREDGAKIDGVTNEEVLRVLIHRLSVLNSKTPCMENVETLKKLKEALYLLDERTRRRLSEGVEGIFKP